MHIQEYLDVDRQGNGYILTVKHDVNKKNEPVETIVQVKHLGKVTRACVFCKFKEYPLWTRTLESGDIKHLFK